MRATTVLLPLALALASCPLRAQALAWDVPHRGAIVFDRTTQRFTVTTPPSRFRMDWVVAPADAGGHDWRYLACAAGRAPQGFEQPDFDDADWLLGSGEFGTDVGTANQRTAWRTAELCLRTRIDVGRKKPKAVVLRAQHDDGIRVFCNGRLVLADDGFGRERTYVLTGGELDAFQPGSNVLAVRCVNVAGAQYLDLGVAVVPALPPGVRDGDDVKTTLRDEREAAAAVQRDLFGEFRPPPLLLQGELDESGSRVRQAPADLRELAWFVAMDLGKGVTGGSWQADVPRMFRIGDLVLRGKVAAVDAEGAQDVEVAIRTAPDIAPRADGKRFVAAFVQQHVAYAFEGTLRVRRRLELRDGKARVVAFRSELSGRVARTGSKDPCAQIEQVEQWTLTRVHENQDAAFRALVQQALAKGTAQLKSRLRDVSAGGLESQPEGSENSFHSGRLALGLLALIKGGVPKDDPVVERGIAELERRVLIDTYSLGNALMCLEAFHAPPNEFADLKQGVIDRPRKRAVPPRHLELMQQWTGQLLQNVDTRVDDAYLLRFNYTRAPRYDHSVNQYGLLGLYSAYLCGVTIPATAWEAAANHLIAAQVDPHGRLDLELVDYRTLARLQAQPNATRTVSRLTTAPAGWNYQEPKQDGIDRPTWGSMTCSGITGLAICQAALLDNGKLERTKLQNDATAARHAGFGWLAERMSFRFHPGAIDLQQHWFYYYLYGLERAALLSGVALIQDRDWYFEGSMVLVLSQLANGDWPGEVFADQVVERDAMAILFLKQGTLPVLTGQ